MMFVYFILLMIGVAFYNADATSDIPRNPCVCPMNYLPVCGKDRKTYSNECNAKCSNVEVEFEGECQKGSPDVISDNPKGVCICTMEYWPVCGKDGKTYGNACAAKCSNVEVAYEGKCKDVADETPKDNCICNRKYRPVCGKNGRTYGNRCTAKCAKVEVASNGKCSRNKIAQSVEV